jgi:hypothetical protein
VELGVWYRVAGCRKLGASMANSIIYYKWSVRGEGLVVWAEEAPRRGLATLLFRTMWGPEGVFTSSNEIIARNWELAT